MSVVEAVRRPEYTGVNRCWPCTTLNVALLGVLSVATALVWLPGAPVVAVLGGAAVWLRGYFVPYTPRFGPRIARRLPIEFESAGSPSGGPPGDAGAGGLAGPDPDDPESLLGALVEAGVMTGGDRLHLADEFRAAWRRERSRLAELDGEALAAAAVEAAPGEREATVHDVDDGEWVRLVGEEPVILSRPVVIAELGAARALSDLGAFDGSAAATGARAVRAFVEECPVCEAEVVESSTANCCGGRKEEPRPVLQCPDCERRLYTFPAE